MNELWPRRPRGYDPLERARQRRLREEIALECRLRGMRVPGESYRPGEVIPVPAPPRRTWRERIGFDFGHY